MLVDSPACSYLHLSLYPSLVTVEVLVVRSFSFPNLYDSHVFLLA